jgi:hypothetical protein
MSQPWERRDRKVTRRSTSMKVTGRSAFVIAAAQAKRDAALTTCKCWGKPLCCPHAHYGPSPNCVLHEHTTTPKEPPLGPTHR